MLIYLCLSSHGYGHATRQAAVLESLNNLRPEIRIVVSSMINLKFLRNLFSSIPVEFRRFRWDIGMVQKDAFTINIEETLKQLTTLETEMPLQLISEVEWIKSQNEKTIVLADIPPSAAELATLLKTKCIWFGNFGWDDIYKPLGNKFSLFVKRYSCLYSQGDLLLRCPFSLPMLWGVNEISLGLTTSKPRNIKEPLLDQLNSNSRPIIMFGFGGLGYKINLDLFRNWSDHLFLLYLTRQEIYNIKKQGIVNVIPIPEEIRVNDVLKYCSRYLTKPGYSSFCEALTHSVGVHAFQRENFIESKILINTLKLHGDYRIMREDSLDIGDWELDKPLIKSSNLIIKKDGSIKAAKEIIKFCDCN